MINLTDIAQRRNRRPEIIKFLAHLIVILMLFILPELIMNYMSPWRTEIQWVMYVKSSIFIAVFYIEYYYIISRTLSGGLRPWRFIAYNLLLTVLALAAGLMFWYFMFYQPHIAAHGEFTHHGKMTFRLISSVTRDTVMIILTIGLAVALRLSDKWAALERRHKDMADEQRATELRNLKSQLNPHFLFNTLNSIYALIDISPKEAQDAVHRLSQMLRYMLYQTPAFVTLQQEVDFTLNYINLMELRMSEGVVNVNCAIDMDDDTRIAPLIFISIVENAFKHGNTGKNGDSIDIEIKASKDGTVICHTTNRFETSSVPSRRGGIGISNLRRRLQLIYGNRAQLSTSVEGNVYDCRLVIKTDITDRSDNGADTMHNN